MPSQVQLGSRKVIYFSVLAVICILCLSLVWYFRDMGSSLYTTQLQGRLLESPPDWYKVISATSLGATTGFKVDLHRFRAYGGDVTLGKPGRVDVTAENCRGMNKWAVITTIAPETTSTMKVLLDSSDDWCLLVVGDKKSPDSYALSKHVDRFIYLPLAKQLSLPFEIIPMTPQNSFSRKNVGFLYAVANGAKIILDMDDDNIPIELFGKFIPVEEESDSFMCPVVNTDESHVWNPYPYYGASNAWPRGYPLDQVMPLKRDMKTNTVKCLPVVQQFLANRDPDLDAIYRLSHPLPMDFETKDKKKVVLPHGVFVPYNAQATIHLYQAFWSLFLPKTVNGRVSDIWRSYISQYMLNYTPDVCLMFAPPAVRHERNSHNYLQDFYSELPLYVLASKLVEMLATTPPKLAPYEVVFRDVYVLLYETGVLEEDDIKYVIAWINDLKNVGYTFPTLNSE